MGTSYCVYMLECNDGTLYTGYTIDIVKRLHMHESGKGAKYTRGRGPFSLKYKEEFITKELAMQREHAIKQLSKEQKLYLIRTYEKEGK